MSAFDFERAIQLSRDFFPQETSKVTFVDLGDTEAQQKIENWVKTAGYAATRAEWYASVKVALGGVGLCFDSASDTRLLYLNSLEMEKIFESKDKELLHSFFHELGHAIIPGGATNFGIRGDYSLASVIRREIMADVFYAILGLKMRFASKNDILRLADFRARRVWETNGYDSAHMTSPALETALDLAEKTDLKSYMPSDIINAVSAIAAQHAPDLYELRSAQRVFSGPFGINRFLCFFCGLKKNPESVSSHEMARLKYLFNSKGANKIVRRVAKAALESITQKKSLAR